MSLAEWNLLDVWWSGRPSAWVETSQAWSGETGAAAVATGAPTAAPFTCRQGGEATAGASGLLSSRLSLKVIQSPLPLVPRELLPLWVSVSSDRRLALLRVHC